MPSSMTRRHLLSGLTAMTTLPVLSKNTSNSKKIKITGDHKTQICVFSKHLQFLDYSAMAETAAEIGFDGVDIPVRPGGHVLPEQVQRDLPIAIEACMKAGLTVPMITTGIVDADDNLTEPVLKVAGQLGVRFYRLGYLRYEKELTIPENLKNHGKTFEVLEKINRKYKIHGAYQNHAGANVGAPVWDLWTLLKGLDPRWMGVQYDIRHATVEGANAWPIGLKLLAAHIKTTVIKDFKWDLVKGKWRVINIPVGEGMVDFKRYFEQVKALGISGPISMHFEYPMVAENEQKMTPEKKRKSVIKCMKKDVEALRRLLGEAGIGS